TAGKPSQRPDPMGPAAHRSAGGCWPAARLRPGILLSRPPLSVSGRTQKKVCQS
ncbi:hypothetical protein AAFF_G00171310, partial [Aldrovandia affinis]